MMKKTNIACTLIVLFFVAICVIMLCVTNLRPQPQYFRNSCATFGLLDMYDIDDIGRDTTTPVDEHKQQYVLQIFGELSKMYGVEKNAPKVANFHPHDTIESQYSQGCIYINFMDYDNIEDGKSAIAHELIHYLSDNNDILHGFCYTLDDTLLLGHIFDEGVANYFSTKYASNSTYYQYETHVASLIAICYGEEALAKDFFSSDVTKLRNDFNNSLNGIYTNQYFNDVTVTPFDLMTSMLNAYVEYTDNTVRINQMLAIDEMLLFYAQEKGLENEVKNEIASFATAHNLHYLLPLAH